MTPRLVPALLAIAACGPYHVVPLAPTELALAIVLDADDALVSSQWIEAGTTGEVSVVDGHSAQVFEFPLATYAFHGDGRWIDNLPSVTLDDQTCRRCYAPEASEPQPAYPGESCRIPSTLDARGYDPRHDELASNDERIGLVRARARLSWPGEGPRGCFRVGLVGQPGKIESTDFPRWLSTQGAASQLPSAAVLDAQTLAAFDVLIVRAPERTYTSTESRALRDWVSGGGGVIALAGFGLATEPGHVNALLSALDVEFFGSDTLLFGNITYFAEHPTTVGLIDLEIGGAHGVRSSTRAESLETIAALEARTFGAAFQLGRGRVFLWGDEVTMEDGRFASAQTKLFWANALNWLGPRTP